MTNQPLALCAHCQGTVLLHFSDMWRCTRCNTPINPALAQPPGARPAAPSQAGHIVAMLGGVMVAIAPFLPWVTAGILSASGLQKTGNETLILVVVGLLVALLGLLVLVRAVASNGLVHLLAGIACLALLGYYWAGLTEHIASLNEDGGLLHVELGAGIYVGLLGALLMVAGGIAALASGKRAA